MKPEFQTLPLKKNEEKHRFEMHFQGFTVFINYIETGRDITLTHTESPEELSGKGAGTALVEKTLESIKQTGKKVIPSCPFVAAFIQKNPGWKTLVDESFRGFQEL